MIYKRGSTIIEVLVAATLISVGILAALSLSSNSQKQTDFSRDLNQATVYNNQAVDWLRNTRTVLGWGTFVDGHADNSTATYCINTLPSPSDESGFYALPAGVCGSTSTISGTSYQREMTLEYSGTPVSSVTVKINTYWQTKAHKATTETVLTDW